MDMLAAPEEEDAAPVGDTGGLPGIWTLDLNWGAPVLTINDDLSGRVEYTASDEVSKIRDVRVDGKSVRFVFGMQKGETEVDVEFLGTPDPANPDAGVPLRCCPYKPKAHLIYLLRYAVGVGMLAVFGTCVGIGQMSEANDYRGIARVFWSGRSQAVRLPAACRFDVSEVEIVKQGDTVTLRPRGKDWAAFFDSPTRGSLPEREQPPLEEREGFRW